MPLVVCNSSQKKKRKQGASAVTQGTIFLTWANQAWGERWKGSQEMRSRLGAPEVTGFQAPRGPWAPFGRAVCACGSVGVCICLCLFTHACKSVCVCANFYMCTGQTKLSLPCLCMQLCHCVYACVYTCMFGNTCSSLCVWCVCVVCVWGDLIAH